MGWCRLEWQPGSVVNAVILQSCVNVYGHYYRLMASAMTGRLYMIDGNSLCLFAYPESALAFLPLVG